MCLSQPNDSSSLDPIKSRRKPTISQRSDSNSLVNGSGFSRKKFDRIETVENVLPQADYERLPTLSAKDKSIKQSINKLSNRTIFSSQCQRRMHKGIM